MKCPKCQYIGFDNSDRCRNCGYEFSLAPETTDFDLPLKTGNEPAGPLTDFALGDVDGLHGRQDAAGRRGASHTPSAAPDTGELPLFGRGRVDDDAPLVTLPASPRAPVAVRRSSPAVRPAPRRDVEEPELELEFPPEPSAPPPRRAVVEEPHDEADTDTPDGVAPAPIGARLFAGLTDLVLLASIDAAVFFLTLKVCGLRPDEFRIIPVVPFVSFLALLNGGYMSALTAAGGQSLGKMIAGIKVVTTDPEAWTDRVPLGQSILRTVGYVVAILPAGLGFVPALFGAERRGIHDRLAHTRVVKA